MAFLDKGQQYNVILSLKSSSQVENKSSSLTKTALLGIKLKQSKFSITCVIILSCHCLCLLTLAVVSSVIVVYANRCRGTGRIKIISQE